MRSRSSELCSRIGDIYHLKAGLVLRSGVRLRLRGPAGIDAHAPAADRAGKLIK